MEELKQIGLRFLQIRKHFGEIQKEFAEAIDVYPTYIGKIETGSQQPSFDVCFKLGKKRKVSLDWLLFGKGQMFQLPEDHFLNKLSDIDVENLSILSALIPEVKNRIWGIIKEVVPLLQQAPKQK